MTSVAERLGWKDLLGRGAVAYGAVALMWKFKALPFTSRERARNTTGPGAVT